MMNFKLPLSDVTLTNLNIHRELHGDEERVVGVDLNFKMLVEAAVLDKLSFNLPISYAKLLYDEKKNLRYAGFSCLRFNSRYLHHSVDLFYASPDNALSHNILTVKDATIGKFIANFQLDGIVELLFQVQITPTQAQAHWLTDGYVEDMWKIQVLGPLQEDLMLIDEDPSDALGALTEDELDSLRRENKEEEAEEDEEQEVDPDERDLAKELDFEDRAF